MRCNWYGSGVIFDLDEPGVSKHALHGGDARKNVYFELAPRTS